MVFQIVILQLKVGSAVSGDVRVGRNEGIGQKGADLRPEKSAIEV